MDLDLGPAPFVAAFIAILAAAENPKTDCKKPVRDFRAPGMNTRTRKMFAVIRTGGKQYRVAAEDVIRIDGIDRQLGEIVEFGDVLMLGGDTVQLGAPTVAGATVAGEVLEHTRGDKVIAFKKRRRKNSRRKRGYRHDFTVIRITEILTEGQKPSKVAKPRPRRQPKPAETEAEAAEAKETKPAAKAKPSKAPAKKAAAKKPPRAAAKKPAKAAGKATKSKKK
jgi:large subunit ribosomal protein L21